MAATLLLTALATTLLLVLAHVRTGEVISQSAGTTVVGEGEILEASAARPAPDAPVGVTLARIAESDSLDGTTAPAGSRLLGPDSGRE